jgi:hypothetical protein
MSRLLNNLFATIKKCPRRSRPKTTWLQVEDLEERAVPTVVFSPFFQAETLIPAPLNFPYTTISSAQVNLIFWGKYWGDTTGPGPAEANALLGEAQTILSSNYFNPLTQYGSDGKAFYVASYIDKFSDPPNGYSAQSSSSAVQLQNEIASVINNAASGISGPPGSATQATAPIYVVVVDPNHSDTNGGYNYPGVYTIGFVSLPINMISIGTSSGSNMGLFFGDTFSHEMAERITDPTGDNFGVRLNPPSGIPSNASQGNNSQIGDNEPAPAGQRHYDYRLGGPGGVAVQPYWSALPYLSNPGGAFIVDDGNVQQVILSPEWTVTTTSSGSSGSFSGRYNLTILGDQLGPNTNDRLTIDDNAGGTKVTLNGEVFSFDARTIDTISVNLGGGNDIVNVESTVASITPGIRITINLGSGTDTVNISPTAKDLNTIKGKVDVIGGGGADTLNVNDQNQNGPFAHNWSVTGGSISRDFAATITYSGVPNLVLHGGKAGDTFTLSPTTQNLDELPGTNDSLLSVQATSLTIDGGSGGTLILDDQNNPNGSSWSVTGSNVTRSYSRSILVHVSFSINYSNVANLELHAGRGDDTFTLSPTAKDLDELPGDNGTFSTQTSSLTVDGGAGANTLILDDQNNPNSSSWSVSGSNVTRSYRLGRLEVVSSSINYSNVANLELHGGKGGNTFTLSPTAQDLDELPGGNGTFSTQTSSLTVDGGTGANTLILDDQNNPNSSSWSVSGSNVTRSYRLGRLDVVSSSINYSNVANLELHGGKGGNTFTLSPTKQDLDELPGTNRSPISFQTTSLTVDGGAGSNTLVLDDQNNPHSSFWSVTGKNVTRSYRQGTGFLTQDISFSVTYSNVASLTINGGTGNNSFVVSGTPSGQVTVNGGTGANKLETDNADHTITITGHNAGNYANVSFVNIGSLAGGTGVDVFKLNPPGQLDGTIDGGGAPAGQGNWLDYSARTTAVTVNLATGSATGVAGGVSNIQNVIGSAGNDTLTGNGLGNILIGGAGTNVLTGGSGRNLLIGGKGASTIVGGPADDILIAGTTTFDNNTSALMSILQEWQRTDKDYAQRIADLRSGGGFNGSNKLILGSTVLDNDGASKLTGGGGLDWFFADLASGVKDTITDLKNGEQVN